MVVPNCFVVCNRFYLLLLSGISILKKASADISEDVTYTTLVGRMETLSEESKKSKRKIKAEVQRLTSLQNILPKLVLYHSLAIFLNN